MEIKYREGYKYQLAEDYRVYVGIRDYDISTEFIGLNHLGLLTIKRGYAWDGPSGPTVDTPDFMRGSLVHDALYQLIRMELLPPDYKIAADDILHRICIEDGMSKIRAWYVHQAVLKAGGSAADPKNKKQILRAPRKGDGNEPI